MSWTFYGLITINYLFGFHIYCKWIPLLTTHCKMQFCAQNIYFFSIFNMNFYTINMIKGTLIKFRSLCKCFPHTRTHARTHAYTHTHMHTKHMHACTATHTHTTHTHHTHTPHTTHTHTVNHFKYGKQLPIAHKNRLMAVHFVLKYIQVDTQDFHHHEMFYHQYETMIIVMQMQTC